MKKLLYTFLAVSLIFSACKKEDDSPNSGSTNNTSASIIGIWEMASHTGTYTQGYLDPIQGTEIVTSTETASLNYPTIDGGWHTWTFASDGGFTAENAWSDTIPAELFESSYVKDGNTITVDDAGEELDFTITTLTNSALSIHLTDYFTWTDGNDTTYFENWDADYTFNKSNKKIDSSIQSQNKTSQTPFFKQFIDRKNK